MSIHCTLYAAPEEEGSPQRKSAKRPPKQLFAGFTRNGGPQSKNGIRLVAVEPCERCGFDIEAAEYVWPTQHMLFVEPTKRTHRVDPSSAKLAAGEPFLVCGHCHGPRERILQVVEGTE